MWTRLETKTRLWKFGAVILVERKRTPVVPGCVSFTSILKDGRLIA